MWCWAGSPAQIKAALTRAILDALAEEYHFDLNTPFEEYPDKIKDVIINGTHGKEIKVHYKGQRGEGIYDVAFEGLVQKRGAPLQGDRFGVQQAGVRILYAYYPLPDL